MSSTSTTTAPVRGSRSAPFSTLVLLVSTVVALAACSESGPSQVASDLAIAGSDAGSPVDLSGKLRTGDAGVGAECTFNRDCVAEARCECDLATGCFCRLGVRGSGRNGIDGCTDGNDCASSLCVEGTGGAYYCSDECAGASECEAALPNCKDIALLGRICTR